MRLLPPRLLTQDLPLGHDGHGWNGRSPSPTTVSGAPSSVKWGLEPLTPQVPMRSLRVTAVKELPAHTGRAHVGGGQGQASQVPEASPAHILPSVALT